MTRSAEYERRYVQYAEISQPQVASMTLRVEIYPDRREVEIRGTYRLVNMSEAEIDSIHLSPRLAVETGPAEFDHSAKLVLDDDALGYRIYVLRRPLAADDSVYLNFTVRFAARGFTNKGVDPSVADNGTYFEGAAWLPAIGYQRIREIPDPGRRTRHGLPPQLPLPSPEVAARIKTTDSDRIAVDAIVGTAEGQMAVAPGALRRTWTENSRRYFHYATDVPIRPDFAIYSARYAVHQTSWNDVSIQVVHHPKHSANVDRMAQSIQASLEYLSRTLGPYPHHDIRLVERYGSAESMHSSPVNISYTEGFSRLKPQTDSQTFSFPFAVVAHEMAHQWWGNQLRPARAEGAALLTESLAWYSAMRVVETTYGVEHLNQLLGVMREAYMVPSPRAAVPLLRATDWFHAYRKGPFAIYALDEYIGAQRVDTAISRFFKKYASGASPLPTSLDLYEELKAVTPTESRQLLADLFETNTFWDLYVERVAAKRMDSGAWQVTLDVNARKEAVDTEGRAMERPLDDMVEVGVFAGSENGGRGKPLYLTMHRIRGGRQRITVTVPSEPAQAGIDPRNLLIDVEPQDNVRRISSIGN